MTTTTLAVAGMSCGACERHIARALEGMSGVIDVRVDLRYQQVTVGHQADGPDLPSLIAAIRDAGYESRAAGHDPLTACRSQGAM